MAFLVPSAARANWTVIPGKTVSAPAAVWSPDTNKVYIVVGGSNNNLWFAAVNQNKTITMPFVNIAGSSVLLFRYGAIRSGVLSENVWLWAKKR
jgi:hypothetical protein